MADNANSFFAKPAVAIVTGASKGIGRAIAIEFAKRFTEGLLLVLTGRSDKDLQETVSLIQADSSSPSKLTVRCVVGDLQNQSTIQKLFGNLFEDINPSKYDHAILINNAGSTGDISKYVRNFGLNDLPELQDFFFLNVNCPLLLVSKFLSVFSVQESASSEKRPSRLTIVQITSLAAVIPIKSWSIYCTGKASRDALHRIIAAEEPSARVLSYGPGPVMTDMLRHGRDFSGDPDTANNLSELYKRAVQPQKTASVLCNFLEEDKYESGAHVEFGDITGAPR
ncbi:Sepiapterin reductase [Holothuria leucospilota]|uniref:Sepiapterin reductase n=1 Tax=Holothuria leucospilota TaxID=206669 RepID=A0A9Q0YQI8_HOLLE|nr:Sepiapterin reductase [Holothuria leucospilota]